MNQKPRLTLRQALKMALKDVGGVILYGLLFAAGKGRRREQPSGD